LNWPRLATSTFAGTYIREFFFPEHVYNLTWLNHVETTQEKLRNLCSGFELQFVKCKAQLFFSIGQDMPRLATQVSDPKCHEEARSTVENQGDSEYVHI